MGELRCTSAALAFTRDGHTLLSLDEDGLVVAGTRAATTRIPVTQGRAVVGFADQLWVVHGAQPVLRRYALDGRPLGAPLTLQAEAPRAATLVAAAAGAPAAVWTSAPLQALVHDADAPDADGELVEVPAPEGQDLALPLTGRRWVTASGSRLVVPSGLSCELAPGARVMGGAIVLDGSAVLVVAERPSGRELLVIGLANGRPMLRLGSPSTTLRVAARRGLLAILGEPRGIGVVELRTGRALGRISASYDIADFVLDPDGQRVALRSASGAIELRPLSEALATTRAAARVAEGASADARRAGASTSPDRAASDVLGAPEGALAASSAPDARASSPSSRDDHAERRATGDRAASPGDADVPVAGGDRAASSHDDDDDASSARYAVGCDHTSASVRDVAEPHAVDVGTVPDAPRAPRAFERPLDLRALAPLAHPPPVDRDLALALLDQDTRTVALWTLRAIADAWDTRQLGYGNEGRHPHEHEVAALLGMNRGFAEDYVAAARDHLAEHEAALAPVAERRGPATPLGALASEFGLSSLAVEILLVVAAPALWSKAARLYGVLANDPARALVDEALVEQILGERVPRHQLARELDPRAPLVALGVLQVDRPGARPFAPLAVDPIILARLRRDLPDLGAAVSPRGSDRALEELALGPHVIATALADLSRAPQPARLALRGRPGSGRRTLLASLAAEAGRALGVVEVPLLLRSDLTRELGRALRRAQLAGLLPCVVGLEELTFTEAEPHGHDALVEVLRAHPGPLAVVLPPGHPAPLDAGHVSVELPVLAEHERLTLWSAALADAGLDVDDVPALAARYRLGPGVIHRAIAATVARKSEPSRLPPGAIASPRRGPTSALTALASLASVTDRPTSAPTSDAPADATAELERFIRQTRDNRLGAHARRVERLGTWDKLVLPPDVLDSLRELVARVRHRRTVFELWGMEDTMATSRGLTALFSGPPGTGKTLVAGVIARELGLDLYQVDLSKMVSKWVGETERNLGALFDAAEDGQVILLFDEADSLFAKRTEVKSSNDRYANLEVNYLLQRLDSFEGIAILTSNAGGAIDPAFKRRLSFRLSFPFPDEETREQLWRAHLPPRLPIAGPLALDKLAHKYQLSGGYIRNACLRAAFLAAQDTRAVSQDHLERAVALEFAELGKLSSSGAIE